MTDPRAIIDQPHGPGELHNADALRPIIPPCTGLCRSKRPIQDTGRKNAEGRRIPACGCCGNVLRLAGPEELAELITNGVIGADARPGSIAAWMDDYCGFNFVAMKAPS